MTLMTATKRCALFITVFSILGPVMAMGWRGSPEQRPTAVFDQTYDVSHECAFAGTILRVDPDPCVALPVSSYHLLVQIDQETVEVHLGPCGYIADQKPVLKKGDVISGTGSEAAWRSAGRRVIIAREIRRDKEVLKLRDGAGKGLWQN